MNKSDFLSLGTTRQLDFINRLEEVNRQKQELIVQLEKDYETVIKRTSCLVYTNPQEKCEKLKKME